MAPTDFGSWQRSCYPHSGLTAVGDDGLGFTVVTRTGHDAGQCMVYVKNILQQGAAAKDGRLKPGDLILEVHKILACQTTIFYAVSCCLLCVFFYDA